MFLSHRYLVRYKFHFPTMRFLSQNHLALFKDRFLKKMLLKRAKTHRLFKAKLQAQINHFFTIMEINFRFCFCFSHLKTTEICFGPLNCPFSFSFYLNPPLVVKGIIYPDYIMIGSKPAAWQDYYCCSNFFFFFLLGRQRRSLSE